MPSEYNADALGAIHFEVSGGTPEARQHFFLGLAALHSFWYHEAIDQFQAAIDADKTFSMAYWGLAMSHSKLLWGEDDVAAGRAAIKNMPAPTQLPRHDQAWVVAASQLFRASNPDPKTRRLAFRKTMEQLNATFPDDESALFLALAILSTIEPHAPDELLQRVRAGGLAFDVFMRNPKHPGAAHYVIHAFDTPALAPLALPEALQYAKIAPTAFHALHMPAHVFARLGMWKRAMASCQAAWDASVAWVRKAKLPVDNEDFHSLEWMIEISFERGRHGDAERAMKTFEDAVRGGATHRTRAAYANQVTSFLARNGQWSRLDELLAPLKTPASDAGASDAAFSELIEQRAVLGARAQAAAELHQLAALRTILDQKEVVDGKLRPMLVTTQGQPFVDHVDHMRPFVRDALLALARKDDRALVTALRPLADDQDQEFTGEGTAGGILRAEEIADALLRQGDASGALAQYRVVLANHVGRASSLLGAARAAAKAGDSVAARGYYQSLIATWSEADPDQGGLSEAASAAQR